MALFKITVKRSGTVNNISLAVGMSVEVISAYKNPVTANGGHQVIDAFKSKYNIDIKKARALNNSSLNLIKM